jgi:hypothetical protein
MGAVTRRKGQAARLVSTSLRFPVEEYLAIRRAARRQHMTVSDYIRSCVPGVSITRGYRRSQTEE